MIALLRERGIRSERVLAAMAQVPREAFVHPETLEAAYANRALPIDCQQTISQPYIVALMTEAFELTGSERVLEIGTGSGYQTAILAQLAAEIVTIERHPALAQQAAERFAKLGDASRMKQIVGDGAAGYPPRAPYDRILVAAAAGEVPKALLEQLNSEGILIIPVGNAEHQVLQAIRRHGAKFTTTPLARCRFVPFVGTEKPDHQA